MTADLGWRRIERREGLIDPDSLPTPGAPVWIYVGAGATALPLDARIIAAYLIEEPLGPAPGPGVLREVRVRWYGMESGAPLGVDPEFVTHWQLHNQNRPAPPPSEI